MTSIISSPYIEDGINYGVPVIVESKDRVAPDPSTVPWRPHCQGSEGYTIYLNIQPTLRNTRVCVVTGGQNWEEGKALAHHICQVHNAALAK